jgi:hypothetical protein
MNAEEANQGRGTAGRPPQDGGASANFSVRMGGGNLCSERGGYKYRGGRDGGNYGGGRR